MQTVRIPTAGPAAVLICAACLCGCGGGDFAAELTDRPQPLVLAADTRTVVVPESQPFSITLAPSQKQPEIGGTAEVQSEAQPTGTARASASVTGGGTATAAFQVGHAFRNGTDRMVDMNVQVEARYRYEVSGDALELPLATATVNLYARDERNRLLTQAALASQSSERGAAGGQDHKTLDFAFPLGPGEAANIYLAGGVQIDASNGHTASGMVELDSLRMRIEAVPAPAVRAAPATRPATPG